MVYKVHFWDRNQSEQFWKKTEIMLNSNIMSLPKATQN